MSVSDDQPSEKSASGHPKSGEFLFEFQRASDGVPMSIHLRDLGSDAFEVLAFERNKLFARWGGFETRLLALAWAEEQRRVLKRS